MFMCISDVCVFALCIVQLCSHDTDPGYNTRCAVLCFHWSAFTFLASYWSMVTTLSLAIDTCRDWTLSNIPIVLTKTLPGSVWATGDRLFWLTRGPFDPLWLSWHRASHSKVMWQSQPQLQTLVSLCIGGVSDMWNKSYNLQRKSNFYVKAMNENASH